MRKQGFSYTISAKNQTPQQEEQIKLAQSLILRHRSGIRTDSGVDMPPPAEIVGDAFDDLGIPKRASNQLTLAQTVRQWLTTRTVALLREQDPRLNPGLKTIRRLVFFYYHHYHHVEGFLSNAQLSGDSKKKGRFKTVEGLQAEWEVRTGLKIADLPRLSPHTDAQELDRGGVLPVTSRTATNSIDEGLLLFFDIQVGRARALAVDVSLVAKQEPNEAALPTDLSPDVPSAQTSTSVPTRPTQPPNQQAVRNSEALVHLARSVTPDQAFSKYSAAFALEINLWDSEEMIDRWLAADWVKYIGHLHDVEAYVIPDVVRRDVAMVVKNNPVLGDRVVADFAKMPALLKLVNPAGVPYTGTILAKRHGQSTGSSIRNWSDMIIEEMARLGTLEATQQMLRARGIPMLVDELSLVIALQERSALWLRTRNFAIGSTIVFVALFGTGLALGIPDFFKVILLILAFGAVLTLAFSWVVLHQTARAWQVLWAEMKRL